MAITAPATSSTLAVADGKTLTASNSLTLAGTDATTMTFPTTSATIARTDAAQTFTGLQTFGSLTATGNVIGNIVYSLTGTISLTAGVAGTLFTTVSGSAYIVTCRVSSSGTNYISNSLINNGGGGAPTITATALKAGASLTIAVSGADVTLTSAANATASWFAIRIS
jgi:hypothetical protein